MATGPMTDHRRSSYRMSWPDYALPALQTIPECSEGSVGLSETSSPTRTMREGQHLPAAEQTTLAAPNIKKALPPLKVITETSIHSIPGSVTSIAQSLVPPPLQPRPPPRAFRSSISRISSTPSDTPYLVGLLRAENMMDLTKAERMLGLRQRPPSPPAQPTTPLSEVYTVMRNWSDSPESLPKHKHGTPKDRLEPLNGRTAWLHSLTGALIVFNCWGMANAFGLFQAYFETYYLPPGIAPSSISWIGSTQLALVFGLGVPVGRLVDKGYFRLVFHTGSAIMILGIFSTAWCTTLWSLWLVQGLVTGLGMGMTFCSAIVALMTWFDERKLGAAMGVGAAGSCIGGIVYIVIARRFLLTDGFPTTMRILGAVATLALIPPNLVYHVRGQHHRTKRSKQRMTRSIHLRNFTSPSYLLAAAGMFFAFMGVYFGFVYMVSFASTQLKLSNAGSTNLLIYMLAANLPGRFLPALISDKCIGPLNTIIPSIFLSAGCLGLWIALGEGSNARGALTVVACFYGFVSAGVQVLYAPTVYTFCLEASPMSGAASTASEREATQLAIDRMGVKAGGIFTCIGLASLVGTPVGGALIKYRSERGMSRPYLGAQVFAMGCLLLGGSLLLASRVVRIGWQAKRA